jgi:hypothetical protein
MQKLLTTLAVLTVIAIPAFAQSFDPKHDAGNVPSVSAIRAYGMVPHTRSAHVTHLKEGAAYNGNWGFAPGNGDDEWGRSSGFWDTNAPGCPLKSCS